MMDLGKIPPQAVDIEKSVIGGIISEQSVLLKVSTILKAEMFYREEHRLIYQTILQISDSRSDIDILTVCRRLKESNDLEHVGGVVYLNELVDSVVSTGNIEYHCMILQQLYMKREFIAHGEDLISQGFDDSVDVADLIEFNEKGSTGIVNNISSHKNEHIGDVSQENMKKIKELRSNKLSVIGISTGFRKLDETLHGLCDSDFIVIAARPSMGKTALAVNLMNHVGIELTKPVAFFSLEMSDSQLEFRQKSMLSEIDHTNIKTGNLTDDQVEQLEEVTGAISESPVYVDDTPALSIFELRARARKLKYKHDIKLMIVDYIQMMQGEKGNGREREVSSVSSGLKQLAKELNIPVIGLSQLNRSVESRPGDKIPQLSDLRESGSIEQDADVVIFIHRPSYYGIGEFSNGESTDGKALLRIAKHRNGIIGDVIVHFNSQIVNFSDIKIDVNPF